MRTRRNLFLVGPINSARDEIRKKNRCVSSPRLFVSRVSRKREDYRLPFSPFLDRSIVKIPLIAGPSISGWSSWWRAIIRWRKSDFNFSREKIEKLDKLESRFAIMRVHQNDDSNDINVCTVWMEGRFSCRFRNRWKRQKSLAINLRCGRLKLCCYSGCGYSEKGY